MGAGCIDRARVYGGKLARGNNLKMSAVRSRSLGAILWWGGRPQPRSHAAEDRSRWVKTSARRSGSHRYSV